MVIRPLVPALAAALLAACAAGPDYVRPDLPVPARFARADAPSTAPADASAVAADAEFWRGFDAPLLTRLEEQPLASILDLGLLVA